MTKRSESIELAITPASARRWRARANQLGYSVQAWACVVLDRASEPTVGPALPLDPDLVEAILATLNASDD